MRTHVISDADITSSIVTVTTLTPGWFRVGDMARIGPAGAAAKVTGVDLSAGIITLKV